MYLRIQENQIRYRLSKVEATRVIDGHQITDSLKLSNQVSLNYRVSPTQQKSQFEFLESENCLSLLVNRDELIQELDDRPSKQGIFIESVQPNSADAVYLEIDIKKKKTAI